MRAPLLVVAILLFASSEDSGLGGAPGAVGATGPTGALGADGKDSDFLGASCPDLPALPGLIMALGVAGVSGTSGVSCGQPSGVIAETLRHAFVGVAEFEAAAGAAPWARDAVSLRHTAAYPQGDRMIAALHLPLGASVSGVRCFFEDGVVGTGTLANSLQFVWSVAGGGCAPATCACSTPAFSQDDPALHVVPAPLALPLPAACAAPIAAGIAADPSAFTSHVLAVSTTDTSGLLVFHGCDVSFSVTEALP